LKLDQSQKEKKRKRLKLIPWSESRTGSRAERTAGYIEGSTAADNTAGLQIIATTSGAPGPLTVRASQMNVSTISLSSINGAVYPPPASQTISTFQNLNTSSFNVSSINGSPFNVYQNLFTSAFGVSSINGTGWSTIQFLNQSSYPNNTDSSWVVTSSNNVLCFISFISGVQRFVAIPLTIGTYTNASFTTMVNGAIQTFAAANPAYFLQFIVFSVAVVGGFFFSLFTLGAGAPPLPAQYTIAFIPANFANFPPATSAQIIGSALLFGAAQQEYFLSSGALTVQMPSANTTPAPPLPPRAFGSDLQVSSINIRGVPVLPSGAENPPGAIIMFGGLAAPPGWLLCDGTTYSSATYPLLFVAIGYLYGGSGGNFQVPDLQTRIPVGSITATNAPAVATMTLPGFGGSSNYVIIQLGSTAVTTTPINVIVPGCVFTTGGGIGPFTVVQMLYADYGRNVYFCQINATLGGGAGPYAGNITYPKPALPTPNTTLPYQPGFTAPAYYAPSLVQSQIPPHAHNYNIQKGGAATYNTDGANQACGDPNVNFTNANTTQTSPSTGGPGFDTTYLQFPPGLIGPQDVIALGVQPLPTVSVNFIIKV
jgi:microcystin-dependent protein